MNIINISNKDIDKAAETLYSAFLDDPLLLWTFDGNDNYLENAKWAFKTWIRWAMLYGLAIATHDCESVALRKIPGKHHFNFWNLWRAGMLKSPMILGKTVMQRLDMLDQILAAEQLKNMGSDQFWYCWLIGTHQHHQRKGFGKALMDYTFNLAKASKLPCYLETATEENVSIHQKRGSEVISTIYAPNTSIKIYSMKKNFY